MFVIRTSWPNAITLQTDVFSNFKSFILITSSKVGDILTKEKKMLSTFEDVINQNDLKLENTSVNKVMAFGQEVWMTNIRNRTTSP